MGGKAPLPDFVGYRLGELVSGVKYDPAQVQAGTMLYVSNCVFCHGVPGVDRGGNIPNLGYMDAAMIEHLAPLADTVIATRSPSPRAAETVLVAAEARRYCHHVESVEPVAAAVERALQLAAPDDIICVTGSFYTIAEVPRNR